MMPLSARGLFAVARRLWNYILTSTSVLRLGGSASSSHPIAYSRHPKS
jgi:hypothetical protein